MMRLLIIMAVLLGGLSAGTQLPPTCLAQERTKAWSDGFEAGHQFTLGLR
jgi:hypothetical protein